MKLIEKIKAVNWGYLWLAILIGCAGALLLFYPNKTMEVVSISVGVGATLFGAVQLIRFLSQKKRGLNFTMGLISGILTIIAGVICIFLREQTKELIAALVALFLIIDASFKLQTVVRARRLKSKACWSLFVFSLISIVLSFMILYKSELNTNLVLFFLGSALVSDAFGNLISLFYVGWLDREETEAAIRTKFEIQTIEEKPEKKKKKKLKEAKEKKNSNVLPEEKASIDTAESTVPETMDVESSPLQAENESEKLEEVQAPETSDK